MKYKVLTLFATIVSASGIAIAVGFNVPPSQNSPAILVSLSESHTDIIYEREDVPRGTSFAPGFWQDAWIESYQPSESAIFLDSKHGGAYSVSLSDDKSKTGLYVELFKMTPIKSNWNSPELQQAGVNVLSNDFSAGLFSTNTGYRKYVYGRAITYSVEVENNGATELHTRTAFAPLGESEEQGAILQSASNAYKSHEKLRWEGDWGAISIPTCTYDQAHADLDACYDECERIYKEKMDGDPQDPTDDGINGDRDECYQDVYDAMTLASAAAAFNPATAVGVVGAILIWGGLKLGDCDDEHERQQDIAIGQFWGCFNDCISAWNAALECRRFEITIGEFTLVNYNF